MSFINPCHRSLAYGDGHIQDDGQLGQVVRVVGDDGLEGGFGHHHWVNVGAAGCVRCGRETSGREHLAEDRDARRGVAEDHRPAHAPDLVLA